MNKDDKKLIEELTNKIDFVQNQSSKHDPKEHNDKTRSRIAMIFVWGYFLLMGGVFFLLLLFNLSIIWSKPDQSDFIINIQEALLAINSLVGTPLGFVVGYYFKFEEKNND